VESFPEKKNWRDFGAVKRKIWEKNSSDYSKIFLDEGRELGAYFTMPGNKCQTIVGN
jgi:hypothetical protein